MILKGEKMRRVGNVNKEKNKQELVEIIQQENSNKGGLNENDGTDK